MQSNTEMVASGKDDQETHLYPHCGEIQFQRLPATAHRMGQSKSTIWGRIKRGLFPPPVRIGPNCVGFINHETDAIQKAMINGASDDDIRLLVKSLVAARASGNIGSAQ